MVRSQNRSLVRMFVQLFKVSKAYLERMVRSQKDLNEW